MVSTLLNWYHRAALIGNIININPILQAEECQGVCVKGRRPQNLFSCAPITKKTHTHNFPSHCIELNQRNQAYITPDLAVINYAGINYNKPM